MLSKSAAAPPKPSASPDDYSSYNSTPAAIARPAAAPAPAPDNYSDYGSYAEPGTPDAIARPAPAPDNYSDYGSYGGAGTPASIAAAPDNYSDYGSYGGAGTPASIAAPPKPSVPPDDYSSYNGAAAAAAPIAAAPDNYSDYGSYAEPGTPDAIARPAPAPDNYSDYGSYGGAGTPASIAAPGMSANAAPAPTPDDAYLRRVMGSYDPNSSRDRRKAEAIRAAFAENGGYMSPNQMYANEGYKSASHIGPFEMLGGESLRKEASSKSSSFVGRGLSWLGKKLSDSGSAAARKTRKGDAGALPGFKRLTAGGELQARGLALKNDPSLGRGVDAVAKVGLGSAGVGLGLGAWHGQRRHETGLSEGREIGVGEGYDVGLQRGVQGSQAMQNKDPGWMGRIADVFTGQAQGPSSQQIYSRLAEDRAELIKAILQGKNNIES